MATTSFLKEKLSNLENLLKEKESELEKIKIYLATTEEKLSLILHAKKELEESFQALSAKALRENNETFIQLAKTTFETLQTKAKNELETRKTSIEEMIKPVKETLSQLDKGMRELEKERKGDHAYLKGQIDSLMRAEGELKKETANLSKALRSPAQRGRWGEIQLKRVVELAGMVDHCDFYEQTHTIGEEEARVRPDLIVKLPGERNIVIDAKVPLQAYLEAMEQEEEKRRIEKLQEHARHLRTHILALSKKNYWKHITPSPEFVVLFLASEPFFSAALEQDSSLIDLGAENGVILATPTTLIALLRAVSYGWKQQHLSQFAERIRDLGQELHRRILDMTSHFAKVGKSLSHAVESYNKTVGSLESRVLVTARKFNDLGIGTQEIGHDAIQNVEKIPKIIELSES